MGTKTHGKIWFGNADRADYIGREDDGTFALKFRGFSLLTATAAGVVGSAKLGTQTPATDDTYDLGTSAARWKDAYIDGVAYLDALEAGVTPFPVRGLPAAQGGAVSVTGGTSATSALAGGAASLVGGTPGATGVGGAAAVTGGIGGATSGDGGAVTATGGAGTAGNAAGGVASLTGGAGQGSASGGVGRVLGGAGGATGVGGAANVQGGAGGATSGAGGTANVAGGAGANGNSAGGAVTSTGGAGQGSAAGGAASVAGGVAGATGTGGAASVTGGIGGATSGAGGAVTVAGGAGTAGNGNGGNTILAGGVPHGTGKAGLVVMRNRPIRPAGAPAAKTVTAAITAAELFAGTITTTGATAPSVHQLPTGTLLLAELPGLAAGDSFDFFIINIGTGASDDATITVNTDVTIVGNPTVGALTDATIISGSGHFRARYTGGVTWIVYRIA